MSSRRTVAGVVRRSLDRRRDAESDVQPRTYLRPVGRTGLHVVRLECNEEEIVVSGARAFKPGTTVQTGRYSGRPGEVILTEPPPGRRGASAFPRDVVRREIDAFGIVSADPDELEAGATTAVTLTGFGFRQSPVDTFRAVVFDLSAAAWIADPLVTVDSAVWTDAETVEVSLTVDASAPEGYQVALEVERS